MYSARSSWRRYTRPVALLTGDSLDLGLLVVKLGLIAGFSSPVYGITMEKQCCKLGYRMAVMFLLLFGTNGEESKQLLCPKAGLHLLINSRIMLNVIAQNGCLPNDVDAY